MQERSASNALTSAPENEGDERLYALYVASRMTDIASLYRSVYASPREDAPRRALADALVSPLGECVSWGGPHAAAAKIATIGEPQNSAVRGSVRRAFRTVMRAF